jgi:putative ABC transport system permease protein
VRFVGVLASVQVATAFVLVVLALFVGAGVAHFHGVDTGFRARTALVMDISVPKVGFATVGARSSFFEELLTQVRELPGVALVGATSSVPLMPPRALQTVFTPEGRGVDSDPEARLAAELTVTPGYFRVMGVPIQEGRPIDDGDRESSAPVVVISRSLARKFYPRGALGDYLRIEPEAVSRRIVGIAGDVMQLEPGLNGGFQIYEPYRQSSGLLRAVVIESRGDVGTVTAAVRRILTRTNPDLAVSNVTTVEEVVRQSLSRERVLLSAFSWFTVLACGLAFLAVLAALQQHVEQRLHEFRVRVAVGASGHQVARLVLRRWAGLLSGGLCVGLAASFVVLSYLRSVVYELGASPLVACVQGGSLVLLIALAASANPVGRAHRANPANLFTES